MIALPADAAVGGTTATITVLPGSLSISASDRSPSIVLPSHRGGLDTRGKTVSAAAMSTALGVVQVTDARGAANGWVASVICTAFIRPAGPVISASAIGYTAGTITTVGTGTFTANNPVGLSDIAAAVTATGITGNNSATWYPIITVSVPQGTPAGVYTATITHSIL